MSRSFKRTIFFLLILILIPALTYIASRYARGERFDFENRQLTSTGMLVANSVPDGASVWIDGKLKTATDDTINLVPDEYEVEITMDGYHPWTKRVIIKKELVQKTEAHLFSKFPSLQSLTFTGASRPILSPHQQKVVFAVATGSDQKRGLWTLDLSSGPLDFSREPTLLVQDTARRTFSEADFFWAPNSKEILVTLQDGTAQENFILDANRTVNNGDLIDITPTLEEILTEWQEELSLRQEEQLAKLKPALRDFLQKFATQILFSPDMKKIVYTGKARGQLGPINDNPLPPSTSQEETRQIEPQGLYVYDLLEDRNFRVSQLADSENQNQAEIKTTQTQRLRNFFQNTAYHYPAYWLNTSRHLFLTQNNKIVVMEYDGTNWLNVYTGPLENEFAFPFPSGDKALILANIGEEQPSNLYAVTIR